MRNIYFIPLRKGSKSIRDKNFKLFGGHPLFCWSLDAIVKSGTADEIWIATDSEKVENITKRNYPNVKIYRRREENASDISPTIDVVLEFFETHSFNDDDNFILIQATSPLTSAEDLRLLNKAIALAKYDSFVSCIRLKRFRWSEEGKPLDYDFKYKPRRQEYKGFLVESGAFYCSKVVSILKHRNLLSGNIGIIELGSEGRIDIDDPIDWELGEALLKYISKGDES